MTTANKATATPAPWKVAHSGYANSPFVIYAGEKAPNFAHRFPLSGVHAIAEIFHDEGPDHEQQRADANLIAFAPVLLAELQETAFWLRIEGETGDPEAAESRALIHRAEQIERLLVKVEGR